MSQRLGDAQAKIACLSNSKKATTVFSPARYPEVQTIKDTLIFSRTALLTNDEIVKRERKYGIMSDVPHEHNTPSFDIEYQKSSAENFQLFMDCNEHEHKKILPNEGLGKLPALSSVSDFILFNTGETPYQKYDAYDNLSGWWIGKAGTVLGQGQEEAAKQREEAEKKHLEEAPETIEKGEEMVFHAFSEITFAHYTFPSFDAIILNHNHNFPTQTITATIQCIRCWIPSCHRGPPRSEPSSQPSRAQQHRRHRVAVCTGRLHCAVGHFAAPAGRRLAAEQPVKLCPRTTHRPALEACERRGCRSIRTPRRVSSRCIARDDHSHTRDDLRAAC